MAKRVRHLVLVLGDQLDPGASAFDGFDARRDAAWMAEVAAESEKVWATKPRIAVFLAAMRHFRAALREREWALHYTELDDPANTQTLGGELARAISTLRPEKLIVTEPGEWRVAQDLTAVAEQAGVPLEVRTDRHFLCSRAEFDAHAAGRRQLRMEFFYREMRRRHRVLLEASGEPVGGQWNFDPENRGSFGRAGPPARPAPCAFPPDTLTREVIALVERRFASHPGRLERFDWPVTPVQAHTALQDFIAHRLADFGRFQDAIWTGEPWLFHSRLSAALNLKLLDPREVIGAVERAWRAQPAAERDADRAPLSLATVEGFVRQVLGWREFVRGVYWLDMPGMADANHFGAVRPLPAWWWSADTRMACMRETIGQTMREGYAHHIQRLMVTGNFALLAGLAPREVAAWYLAVYVDAVEWVELPNVAGMALYANGGRFTTKPYAASGAYVKRMSDYCRGCAYSPEVRTGPRACPMTTLYWRFLDAHEAELAANPRTALMARNVARLSADERDAIRDWGERLLADLDRV
jgi:deoxyribodipyrimidine photolyase-related protein